MFKHRSQGTLLEEKNPEKTGVHVYTRWNTHLHFCQVSRVAGLRTALQSTFCSLFERTFWQRDPPEVQIKGAGVFHNSIHGFLKQSENERVIVVVCSKGGRRRRRRRRREGQFWESERPSAFLFSSCVKTLDARNESVQEVHFLFGHACARTTFAVYYYLFISFRRKKSFARVLATRSAACYRFKTQCANSRWGERWDSFDWREKARKRRKLPPRGGFERDAREFNAIRARFFCSTRERGRLVT